MNYTYDLNMGRRETGYERTATNQEDEIIYLDSNRQYKAFEEGKQY